MDEKKIEEVANLEDEQLEGASGGRRDLAVGAPEDDDQRRDASFFKAAAAADDGGEETDGRSFPFPF